MQYLKKMHFSHRNLFSDMQTADHCGGTVAERHTDRLGSGNSYLDTQHDKYFIVLYCIKLENHYKNRFLA